MNRVKALCFSDNIENIDSFIEKLLMAKVSLPINRKNEELEFSADEDYNLIIYINYDTPESSEEIAQRIEREKKALEYRLLKFEKEQKELHKLGLI